MPDDNHREMTGMGRDILALLCPDWRRATMIVDARARSIEFANWRCLEQFNDETFVRALGGRVECCSAQLNRRFQLALERIRTTGIGRETLTAAFDAVALAITIWSLDGLLAEIVRSRLDEAGALDSLVVIELVTTGDKPSASAVESLAASFSLTPSEGMILHRFANGATLEEIAASDALAPASVRQAMNNILAKTHCRRQVDLALMVTRLCSD